ncbi:MAG: signal peptide peptidase SppA, partial [Pseudomonadota bacterium]
MTATADMILERRRIRRRLTFWRIIAIAAVLVAVLMMIPNSIASGDHIARVSIDGVIQDDPDRDRLLKKLVDDDAVKAVIVRINSPGGTVVASEALYEQLRSIAEDKPVVAVMTEYAASGGYITALASDYIIARGNTLTGSIGVLSQVPNVAGLMEMIGVGVTRIKSAPLKAEPSVTEVPSPAALKAQEALIADMFGWFRGLVEERRGLSGEALNRVTDGRAFTGRQAL